MPHPEPKSRPAGILRQESSENPSQYASPGSYIGVDQNQTPRGTPKSVSIARDPEVISPLMLGNQKTVDELDLDQSRSPRKFPVKRASSTRLSGRPPSIRSPELRPSSILYASSDANYPSDSSQSHRGSHHHLESLIDQVSQWIKNERNKHDRKGGTDQSPGINGLDGTASGTTKGSDDYNKVSSERGDSVASTESFSLDKLEEIINQNLRLDRRSSRSSISRRRPSLKSFRKQSTASSDTDYFDGDVLVPSCDAVLDNSKTLAYTGGVSDDSDESDSGALERTASYRDVDAWAKFKFEIVRLTHTLRLKGWRRVPLEISNEIGVQRLSGALTNAVYVVSPPSDLPQPNTSGDTNGGRRRPSLPRQPPQKLLLRIYGAQVGHLIERERELNVLKRLSRKNIGPRLLGTFENGRFEQFLNAKPLDPEGLRNPDTSRQIAKRMRELHDGIDLLHTERDEGAFVWCNWDKWLRRVEQIVSWLDCEVKKMKPGVKPTGTEAWKRRGLILGAPWKQFRDAVNKYRAWLIVQNGGFKKIKQQLVFAHNDTQYGNILRLMPTGESPLLLPANTHKQLIVIDFEYSGANCRGLEFANHFSEWCYNYHDARKPYAFHANRYPTPEEQDRCIRAYVRHRPQFNVSTPTLTPMSTSSSQVDSPSRRVTSSISHYMADARGAPSSSNHSSSTGHNAARDNAPVPSENEDHEVARLMHETRIWRLANTAQWIAWGIVQAKVPGMPDFGPSSETEPGPEGEEGEREDLGEGADDYRELVEKEQQAKESANAGKEEEAEEEFDYLGYAQHRAMFFWADAVQHGIVKKEDLSEEVRGKLKMVPY